MNRRLKHAVLVTAIWPLTASALGAPSATGPSVARVAEKTLSDEEVVRKFDANRDGSISPSEAEGFFQDRARRMVSAKADPNGDGKITDQERADYERDFARKVNNQVEFDKIAYEEMLLPTDTRGNVVDDFAATFPLPKTEPEGKKALPPVAVLLRQKPEDLQKDLKTAEPAIVSYTRQFEKDVDAWQTRGVLAVRFNPQGQGKVVRAYSGLLTFDRSTNSGDPTKEVNVLNPGAQFDVSVQGDKDFIQLHEFRATGSYATDFDFDQRVPALELEYEPVMLNFGAGRELPEGDLFAFRWRAIAHAEYRHIDEAGDNTKLQPLEGKSSARLGPKIEMEIRPLKLTPLSLTFGFTHLNDVLEGGSSDYFTAQAKYRLDKDGNVFLTASYREGDVSLLEQATKEFSVGLGLRF